VSRYQRDAVDEKHDIGDDVLIGAGDVELVLRDGQKAVVGSVLEVNIAHGGAFLARLAVLEDRPAAQDQLAQLLVGLYQSGAGWALQAVRHLADLVRFQPGVDLAQGSAQLALDEHLVKALAQRGGGIVLIAAQHTPAQALQLLEEGFFDLLELVQCLVIHLLTNLCFYLGFGL